jgi:hypothetical protein
LQAHEAEAGGRAFLLDPEFLCAAWEWVERAGVKPSSGLVGVLLMLAACPHVHVYGFRSVNIQ